MTIAILRASLSMASETINFCRGRKYRFTPVFVFKTRDFNRNFLKKLVWLSILEQECFLWGKFKTKQELQSIKSTFCHSNIKIVYSMIKIYNGATGRCAHESWVLHCCFIAHARFPTLSHTPIRCGSPRTRYSYPRASHGASEKLQ